MVKETNLSLAVFAVAVCAFVGNATASIVCFNPEKLPSHSGPAAIEASIRSVCGPDITVLNAIIGNGTTFCGSDSYVQNQPDCEKRWFSLRFNEVPVTTVSLNWTVEKDAFYALTASVGEEQDDDVRVLKFFERCRRRWSSCNSGIIYLGSPLATSSAQGWSTSWSIYWQLKLNGSWLSAGDCL